MDAFPSSPGVFPPIYVSLCLSASLSSIFFLPSFRCSTEPTSRDEDIPAELRLLLWLSWARSNGGLRRPGRGGKKYRALERECVARGEIR